jgi:hypothetical protein
MSDARTKREGWVSCLSCGKTSKAFILVREEGDLEPTARCPKCSNIAHTQNLKGLWSFMRAAAKDIAQIKLDMIDKAVAEALERAAAKIDAKHRGDLPEHIVSEDGNLIRAMIPKKGETK